MKIGMKYALAPLVLLLPLAACTPGELDPSVSSSVTSAYNDVCAALPALGPVSVDMSAKAKQALASAQQICAAGAPTNVVVAGLDILTIEQALAPYIKKATAMAPHDAKLARAKIAIDRFVAK